MSHPNGAGGPARPDLLARLQSAIPLLTVYFGLAALYAWQASRHPVPTIFTDELELTQLSRGIAETGEPARRGEPYGLATLVAYFLAPAWWLASTVHRVRRREAPARARHDGHGVPRVRAWRGSWCLAGTRWARPEARPRFRRSPTPRSSSRSRWRIPFPR